MAGTSSWNDASTHHISEFGVDIFSSLEDLSPVHNRFSELDDILEQEIYPVSEIQETPLKDAGHLPNKPPTQIAEPRRVVYRDNYSENELSREAITNCLHLTAKEATKFLGVGSRRFNERCKELGIERWPHRQFKSLNLAIKNFQELCNDHNNLDEEQLRKVIPLLETRKQLLQYIPSLPLEPRTKKLEKVAYNAIYRKRKKDMISESFSSAVKGQASLPGSIAPPDQEQ